MSPLGSSSLTLMTEPETADGQEQMMSTSGSGNTRLRSARQALGLRSQQALADAVTRAGRAIGLRVSVTARTVRRWESDCPPWPHPQHQAALESLLQRPVTDLGFTPPWAEDTAQPSGENTGEQAADHECGQRSVPKPPMSLMHAD